MKIVPGQIQLWHNIRKNKSWNVFIIINRMILYIIDSSSENLVIEFELARPRWSPLIAKLN